MQEIQKKNPKTNGENDQSKNRRVAGVRRMKKGGGEGGGEYSF